MTYCSENKGTLAPVSLIDDGQAETLPGLHSASVPFDFVCGIPKREKGSDIRWRLPPPGSIALQNRSFGIRIIPHAIEWYRAKRTFENIRDGKHV